MRDYFKPTYCRWLPRTIWYNTESTLRWIRWCWQRAFRGWANSDTWSIDYYLSEIIPEMLAHLREFSHGFPAELTEDEWTAILTKIEDGFIASRRMHDFEYEIKDGESVMPQYEADKKIFEEGMDLLKQWYFSLWD